MSHPNIVLHCFVRVCVHSLNDRINEYKKAAPQIGTLSNNAYNDRIEELQFCIQYLEDLLKEIIK